MKMTLIFLAFLFINHIGFSQNNFISGEVRNAEDNKSLPYVNIGIANKTVGTVSDHLGHFKLILNDKVSATDTIIFSFIGFKKEKYLVSELKNKNGAVLLQPMNSELDEVIITAKKTEFKPKKIGRSSAGLGLTHANFYTAYEMDVDDRLSKEMGMKLKIKGECHIKDLNLNITSNDFKSLKFRVNFYRVEDGQPLEIIVDKNIIFEIRDHFLGWFKVDLEPYKIYFSEETQEVAVTIQWLESVKSDEKSKYFSISTASSPAHTSYYREKVMDTWTKRGHSLSMYLNARCN